MKKGFVFLLTLLIIFAALARGSTTTVVTVNHEQPVVTMSMDHDILSYMTDVTPANPGFCFALVPEVTYIGNQENTLINYITGTIEFDNRQILATTIINENANIFTLDFTINLFINEKKINTSRMIVLESLEVFLIKESFSSTCMIINNKAR